MERAGHAPVPPRPAHPGRPLPPRPIAVVLLSLLLFGCGPSPDDPLPPTDDLYAYSLAVAEKARLRVPELEALALYNLGQVHERFGFEDRAIDVFRKAIGRNADLGAAYQRIGFILSQRGDRMAEAIEAYQSALRCERDAVGVHARLALIYLHQGRLDQAIGEIENEHRLPGAASADSYYCLGQAYSKQGKAAEAIAAFRESLRLEPNLLSARYALAVELRGTGDAAGAREAFERFRSLKEVESAGAGGRGTADVSRARERRSAARTWFDVAGLCRQAAAALPPVTGEDASSKAGERLETLTRDLLNALEQAVQLDSGYAEAWTAYFDSLRALGEPEAAAQVAERAGEALPEDGTWPYRGALLRIQLAQSGGDPAVRYPEAVALLEEATRKSPTLAAAHFRLAHTVLMAMKSREGDLVRRAVEHAARAVELDPDPAHYDILAFGYILMRRADLARRSLEDGIRKNPGAPELKQRLEKLLESLEGSR